MRRYRDVDARISEGNKGLELNDFDLNYAGTYYTRPMSEGWSKLRDIDLLADGKAEFDLVVPLEYMARVQREFVRPGNEVRGLVTFRREMGRPLARVELSGRLELICQRCMAPMQWPVRTKSSAILLDAEHEADQLPASTETVLAPQGKVRLIDLIEEELLLALPLVPLHEHERADEGGHESAAAPVQRPFERLGELLKRQR
jgi:uncharacterized protein